MSTPRILTAELHIDGDAITGAVCDEGGVVESFTGWLELIAIVQAEVEPSSAAEPGA